MRCPVCRLINPDTAILCDCGYNFQTHQSQTPPSGDRAWTALPRLVCYNPYEVLDCARRLQARAASIVGAFMVMGLAMGAAILGVVAYVVAKASAGEAAVAAAVLGALVGAAVGGGIGYETGMTRAVGLRLQAQNALCLMAIEANTRNGEP